MAGLTRRDFLAASIGGTAATGALLPFLLTTEAERWRTASNPDTLCLTWRTDPTVTNAVGQFALSESGPAFDPLGAKTRPVPEKVTTVTSPFASARPRGSDGTFHGSAQRDALGRPAIESGPVAAEPVSKKQWGRLAASRRDTDAGDSAATR